MNKFSVCYDKFCIGRFALAFDVEGKVIPFEGLGAFEMYLLGMWNDGMVVTMKGYDEEKEIVESILLMPDGSEQLMTYDERGKWTIQSFRESGQGRFAYLLKFSGGLEYKGFRGYEEYDEEEGLIIGGVHINDKPLTYSGQNMLEADKDFRRIIDWELERSVRSNR